MPIMGLYIVVHRKRDKKRKRKDRQGMNDLSSDRFLSFRNVVMAKVLDREQEQGRLETEFELKLGLEDGDRGIGREGMAVVEEK